MSDDAYPLEAVREVRERSARAAEEALAEALRAHERARTTAAQAKEALARFRHDERRRLAIERERLRSCRATEILRADAYAAKQRAREAALALDVAQARHALHEAAVAVEQAKKQLGTRAVEREVVQRHADRWRGERAKADDRRRDDELDEIAARRSKR